MKLRFAILWITFALLSILPPKAFAWGLIDDIRSEWGRSYLVHQVLVKKQINYCLLISDKQKFRPDSVRLQIESALRIWLNAVQDIVAGKVKIVEVDCSAQELNLRVAIGPEMRVRNQNLGAYQIVRYENGRYFSSVVIDTEYLWKEKYSWIDTANLLPVAESLSSVIEDLSFRSRLTLERVAAVGGLDETALFLSTYRVLIHEFGHSFGLCDTYERRVGNCDQYEKSETQPTSVMKDSTYFYLTKDDLTAIRRVFELHTSKAYEWSFISIDEMAQGK